eukprot:Awhi_evm1s5028
MIGKALFLSVLALGLEYTHAHGAMVVPKSRNMVARVNGEEFCPHCLSAGGPGFIQSVTPGGKFNWPETQTSSVRQGLCGNPVNSDLVYQKPGPVSQTYKSGQVIDIQIAITAHHKGHFEFWLCDQAEVTFECLNKYHLVRVEDSSHPLSPIDTKFPERYHLEPSCAGNSPNDFDKENLASYLPGSQRITMKYKLPKGVTCEHCVLQWWWGTGNSCVIPGSKSFNYPQDTCSSWNNAGLSECGNGGYPEEFWNCADIKITNGNIPTTTSTETTTDSSTNTVTSTTTTDHETSTTDHETTTTDHETTTTDHETTTTDHETTTTDHETTTTDHETTTTATTPTPTSTGVRKCISMVSHITDLWCEQTKCEPPYFGTFCTFDWVTTTVLPTSTATATATSTTSSTVIPTTTISSSTVSTVTTIPTVTVTLTTSSSCVPTVTITPTISPSPSPTTGKKCISIVDNVSDQWCKETKCALVYENYCKWQ